MVNILSAQIPWEGLCEISIRLCSPHSESRDQFRNRSGGPYLWVASHSVGEREFELVDPYDLVVHNHPVVEERHLHGYWGAYCPDCFVPRTPIVWRSATSKAELRAIREDGTWKVTFTGVGSVGDYQHSESAYVLHFAHNIDVGTLRAEKIPSPERIAWRVCQEAHEGQALAQQLVNFLAAISGIEEHWEI